MKGVLDSNCIREAPPLRSFDRDFLEKSDDRVFPATQSPSSDPNQPTYKALFNIFQIGYGEGFCFTYHTNGFHWFLRVGRTFVFISANIHQVLPICVTDFPIFSCYICLDHTVWPVFTAEKMLPFRCVVASL